MKKRDYRGPCTFAVTVGRLEDISKRVLKLAFFLHTVSMGLSAFLLWKCQGLLRRETTEGFSIEFIWYRMRQHKQNGCTILFKKKYPFDHTVRLSLVHYEKI